MKLIKTTVHANKVADVRDALADLNIADMTVTAAASSTLIELVVRDEIVPDVILAITRAARTGEIGDGHVLVFPLDQEGYLSSGDFGYEAI